MVEGSINPAIFQPHWLASVGVFSLEEADEAEPPLVSPGITIFHTSRLSVQVTSDRAVFRTQDEDPPAQKLPQIVMTLFRELPHTPITSIDLVHESHAPIETIRWDDLVAALMPQTAIDGVVPGAQLVSVELQNETDDVGNVVVVLEPSDQIEGAVYLRVHHEFAIDDASTGSAARAMELLERHWSSSLDSAATILGRLSQQQ